jgi:hypothetical protein
MKQFSHAWLAFMAIKRLNAKKPELKPEAQKRADKLIEWFMTHKDDITQGAWLPDLLIKDMSNHHVLKISPGDTPTEETINYTADKLRKLPSDYLIYKYAKDSPVKDKAFNVDKNDNLPDRCESLSEAVVDHFKILNFADKGSPVSPTHNQVALWFFMLSHYVADAHVPVHCDARSFSSADNVHGLMEGVWDKEILSYYRVSAQGTRFLYDADGFPLMKSDPAIAEAYKCSFLKAVDDEITSREFSLGFGSGNAKKVWDFMDAICHNSYLVSYRFFPPGKGPGNVKADNWRDLSSPTLPLEKLSVAVLADAIDSILRVWFFTWDKFMDWLELPDAKKTEETPS